MKTQKVMAFNGFEAAIYTPGRGSTTAAQNQTAALRFVGAETEDENKVCPAKSFIIYGEEIIELRDFLNEITGTAGKAAAMTPDEIERMKGLVAALQGAAKSIQADAQKEMEGRLEAEKEAKDWKRLWNNEKQRADRETAECDKAIIKFDAEQAETRALRAELNAGRGREEALKAEIEKLNVTKKP